ncbi:MAG: TetR/AcrR family transcriptional regulator [Gordonia sp. (in: high G+C Gram-positive bacteria)]
MSPADRSRRPRTAAADVPMLLIAAGRKILERDGVAGLTVRTAASEAGVAPMGVYNHFGGKDGLLDAVVTDGFREFSRAIAANDDAPLVRLLASGRAYREFALANPVLYSLMFSHDCAPADDAARGAFDVLVDVIRYGQVGGVIEAGDPESLAMRVWSCVHGAVSLELGSAYPPDLDGAGNYENVMVLVARGLAPQH